MALSNYEELKKSVENWLHRPDLNTIIDDFILLTEKEMYRATPRKGNMSAHEALNIREDETLSVANVTTRRFALPDDYLSWRSIRLDIDSGGDLRYKAPQSLVIRSGTGRPSYFTITGQVEFEISPDAAYDVEVNYYKKITGLSASNTTNTVLTNDPDIYLYGCLYYANTHIDDEAQALKYWNRFCAAIDGANEGSDEGRYGPAPYARIQGPTP